jgi:hypothetical protein
MAQVKKGHRKSREEMYQQIESWHKSGQSKKVFCEASGLRQHVFEYWRKKYEAEARGGSSVPGFCEVHPDHGSLNSVVRVVYPSGLVVEFSQLPEVPYLQNLLRW